MTNRCRGPMSGPLAPYAPGYEVALRLLGYAEGSARTQLRWMGYLSEWLDERRLDVAGVSDEAVATLLQARRREGGPRRPVVTARTYVPLLRYLRGLGMAAEPVPAPADGPVMEVLERYHRYLASERGLADGTISNYVAVAGLFLSQFSTERAGDLSGLASAEVTDFLLRQCPQRGPGSARNLASGLRSLLRFLYLEGTTALPLAQAVPAAAGWSGAWLPRALGPGQAARLLNSCDRRGGRGVRDHAILTLLIRLGLRAGEVAALSLDDLDWRAGEITVRGKGGHHERLPIPVDVGEALVGYLRRARPDTQSRVLFLRAHAPLQGLTSSGISQVVRDACGRAGLFPVGAHRLRHTAATEMLRAGAPLSEIAQVLRHHSEATTAIYAKVDHDALRGLAQPWPGGA